MTSALLLLLILVCAALLVWGFKKPERMLQYPFLASAVFSGWVLPQLLGLSANPDLLPSGALDKTVLMTMLCIGACYVGHYLYKQPIHSSNWSFDSRRLLFAATLLSLGGAFFFYRVGELAEETVGLWTGIITIFFFLGGMLTTGLAISLVLYVHKPSLWAMSVIIFDMMFYIHRIVFWGRRQSIVELLIMIGLAVWFRYRKLPSRAVVAAVLVIGALWVNSVGEYRSAVMGEQAKGFESITQIDFLGNLLRLATEGGYEMTNAAYNIEAYDRQGNFDFGFSYWNSFIKLYIPGQLIGFENKENLLLQIDNSAYEVFQHRSWSGSTSTGMSDAFISFWYFGAVKFLIIAYVMHGLSKRANRGLVVSQLLLMLIFTGSLESITHNTERFFLAWPRIFIFLGPAIYYARIRTSQFVLLPSSKEKHFP